MSSYHVIISRNEMVVMAILCNAKLVMAFEPLVTDCCYGRKLLSYTKLIYPSFPRLDIVPLYFGRRFQLSRRFFSSKEVAFLIGIILLCFFLSHGGSPTHLLVLKCCGAMTPTKIFVIFFLISVVYVDR